jgi:hypothetical protein
MSDRRAPVKVVLLTTPLLVSILALHAWGDALGGGLGRAISSWQYPETAHASFPIRYPRRSGADVFAARALEEFVSHAVKTHGAMLGIQAPVRPVKVLLLDADTEPRRFGCAAAEYLKENEGLFDPANRMIIVRMEHRINPELVITALREAAARMLLHDAGSARWSPWLAEGLVGRLDVTKASAPRGWTGEVSLNDLLTARVEDFRGVISGPGYTRAARTLVGLLMESNPDGFEYYYKAEQKGWPELPSIFVERFGDPDRLISALKDWPRAPK